jgi:hypothetical protein
MTSLASPPLDLWSTGLSFRLEKKIKVMKISVAGTGAAKQSMKGVDTGAASV